MSSFLVIISLLNLDYSEILWYYPMNDTIPTEWSQSGTVGTLGSPSVECPDYINGNDYCWSVSELDSTLIRGPTSTEGYQNIRLTYSFRGENIAAQDRCFIEYSHDGTVTSFPEQIDFIRGSNPEKINQLFNAFVNGIDNSNGIAIQLRSNRNGLQCYFNEFKLEGDIITADPTIQPTLHPALGTSNPTMEPTLEPTSNPSMEPVTQPIDLSPTKSPVIIDIETSIYSTESFDVSADSVETMSGGDAEIEGIIAAVVIIVCCFIFVVIMVCRLFLKHEKEYEERYENHKKSVIDMMEMHAKNSPVTDALQADGNDTNDNNDNNDVDGVGI